MRKSKSLILIAGVVLACVAVQQAESRRHDPQAAKLASFGFGLKVAGSYFGDYVAHLPDGTDRRLQVLNTLSADGTLVVSSTDMFGDGMPAFKGLEPYTMDRGCDQATRGYSGRG